MFPIDLSRGNEVLKNLRGKICSGIRSCDFWGAYQRFSQDLATVIIQRYEGFLSIAY
ncbi:MAG: hypothetical protein LBT14_02520 [Treponema sp.]|nr:hypothetical protein [Treponema sp.]